MVTQYKPLFEIQCRHAYFGNGICPALQLIPTSECKRLLRRYGCLFRKTGSGGTVFREAQSPWQNLSELAPLSFALIDTNGQLELCTEMGTSPTAAPDLSVHSFSNVTDYGTEAVDGRAFRLLHSPGDAFASSAIPVRPSRFVYEFAKPLTSATLQIFDMLGNEVWKLQTPGKELAALSVGLGDLGEGRYRLKIDKADPYDFYLTGTAPATVWGFVDIFLRSLADIDATPASFAFSLAPRRSFWRYYIVSQAPADRVYDDYQIALTPLKGTKSNGTEAVAFSAPTRQRVRGQDAWVFESADLIPLYEYPADHYEVTLKSNGKGSGISLPYAKSQTTRLAKDADGNVRYCSEMFVYL
ncbi:MAG: hypothetical protein ABSE51_16810 [Terracidiphilus sp.]|jgi:hypothetical protein